MTKYRVLEFEVFLKEKDAKIIFEKMMRIIDEGSYISKVILDYRASNGPGKILKESKTWRVR